MSAARGVDAQAGHGRKFELHSNLPYVLTIVAYRFPGTDSPDFAAARVLR